MPSEDAGKVLKNSVCFPFPFSELIYLNTCSVNNKSKRLKNLLSWKVFDAEHKPPCVSRTNWAAHANQRGIVYSASCAAGRRKHNIKNRPAGFEWWLWCGLPPSSCPATRPPSASWRLHSPSQTPVCWEAKQRRLDGDERKVPVKLSSANSFPPESTLDTSVVSIR